MNNISVISLVSYDHELFAANLAHYIDQVDEVIVGIDAKRLTWAGAKFEIPDTFFADLAKIDPTKKVRIVEDDFFVAGETALDLCTRERNILSMHAKDGNWLVSLDADEKPVNFERFAEFLKDIGNENVAIYGNFLNIFKVVRDRVYVVDNAVDAVNHFPLATKKKNAYKVSRMTEEPVVICPLVVLHYSWARSDEQVIVKLNHRHEFYFSHFLESWECIEHDNIQHYIDFHPVDGACWEKISLVQLDEFENYVQRKAQEMESKLSWIGVNAQARVKLLEGKIIARDANLALLKEEHAKELAAIKVEQERQAAVALRSFKDLKMQLDAQLLANKALRQN